MRTDGRVFVSKSQRCTRTVSFKPAKLTPPTPLVVHGHLHYEVEAVLAHRGDGTLAVPVEYKVKWKGYAASENSWIEHLPAFFQRPLDDMQDGVCRGSAGASDSNSEDGDGYGSGSDSGVTIERAPEAASPFATAPNTPYTVAEQRRDLLAAAALKAVTELVRDYVGNLVGGGDEDSD